MATTIEEIQKISVKGSTGPQIPHCVSHDGPNGACASTDASAGQKVATAPMTERNARNNETFITYPLPLDSLTPW